LVACWKEFSNRNNTEFVASTNQQKSGLYSFKDGDQSHYGYQQIPGTRQVRIGFYVYGNTFANNERFAVRDISANRLVSLSWHLDGTVDLLVAGDIKDTEGGMNIEDWSHVGIDIYIHSSSGWVRVYLDGSEVMMFDGNVGDADIVDVAFGHFITAGNYPMYYDDIYIDDTTGEVSPTTPNIKRLYPINPNADGNYTQWTPSTGTSHYEMVDERPPDDDATFLEAITGSLYDSFDMSTFILDNNEDIIAMIPFVFAKRGSTTEQIALGTRSSGTDSVGSDQDLSTSYNYVWERQTTGSLGSPWNQSYLDSVEVIIKSAGTY
jgi:hypothetical protein